jgi:hypothetical protein
MFSSASCQKPALESTHRGEIIHTDEDLIVVMLKGKCRGLIACAPAKRHINDLTPDCYQLGEHCKFVFRE